MYGDISVLLPLQNNRTSDFMKPAGSVSYYELRVLQFPHTYIQYIDLILCFPLYIYFNIIPSTKNSEHHKRKIGETSSNYQ